MWRPDEVERGKATAVAVVVAVGAAVLVVVVEVFAAGLLLVAKDKVAVLAAALDELLVMVVWVLVVARVDE